MRLVSALLVLVIMILGLTGAVFAVPVDGLVAAYYFDGDATDSSLNNNHGTVHGATLTADRYGNPNSAYQFDGDDDLIRIEASATNSTFDEITICAWVNISGDPTKLGGIVTRWNQDYDLGAYYGIWYDAYYNPSTIVASSNEYYRIHLGPTTSGVVEHNQWFSVIYSISPTTGEESLYINGGLVDQLPRAGEVRTSDLPILIGADMVTYQQDDYWRFFDGAIDDVLIYDRLLTESEILELADRSPVPIPASVLLLGSGIFGIGALRKRFQ